MISWIVIQCDLDSKAGWVLQRSIPPPSLTSTDWKREWRGLVSELWIWGFLQFVVDLD